MTPNPDAEIDDLITKIAFLLDHFHLWSEDGYFTFPDGDTWTNAHHLSRKTNKNEGM